METPHDLLNRLDRIEALLNRLVGQEPRKEFYSTAEAARLLGRAEFTVREWCRHRRIYAEKRDSGRGNSKEWMIAYDEIQRIRNEGLLPS